MESLIVKLYALLAGFVLDAVFGDPKSLPHPIVGFGKTISYFEKRLNKGTHRVIKGGLMTLTLVTSTFLITHFTLEYFNNFSYIIPLYISILITFFSLSALTLRNEVKLVFEACSLSTEKGRKQLSRIVGRDTNNLSPQQIRVAALETLSENLSDGVIAPLFWFALLGAPGMITYKMINTLDSMIGYKNERYLLFGRIAAKLDDAANYIPARLTAIIMLLVTKNQHKLKLVFKNGKNHASPNSGYPEAALAEILNCRFGGPNFYFGAKVEKPYIGQNEKIIDNNDLRIALKTNQCSEYAMLILTAILIFLTSFIAF